MIALLGKLFMGFFLSVQLRYSDYIVIACKTYLFSKQKYFAPIQMLFNKLLDRIIITNIYQNGMNLTVKPKH